MSKTLQLNFNTAGDKKVMLTVDEPRTDLTAEQVGAAMQVIIDSGVFKVDDFPLASAVNARIVERTVTEIVEA